MSFRVTRRLYCAEKDEQYLHVRSLGISVPRYRTEPSGAETPEGVRAFPRRKMSAMIRKRYVMARVKCRYANEVKVIIPTVNKVISKM